MSLRFLALVLALLPAYAGAADPERASNTIKLVQEKLHIHGFYSGPIDGDPSGATQAALAQFQLSRSLPADGSPDRRTLDELGVVLDEPASQGASAPPSEGASALPSENPRGSAAPQSTPPESPAPARTER